MLQLVWTTDLHLDHAPIDKQERWLRLITSQACDGLLIGGDLAEDGKALTWLEHIASSVDCPIYFVFGNHDYYGQSISQLQQEIIRSCREHDQLHYLTDCSAIPLSSSMRESQTGFYLVGDDGWGDATEGDFENSFVQLADFARITDFASASDRDRKRFLRELGLVSAQRLAAKLTAVPNDAKHVLVLTHVPPFVDACWYEGKTADSNWSPFFVCGQIGDVLEQYAIDHPECKTTVLCGHTHHSGFVKRRKNLVLYTGAAELGNPSFAGKITIDAQTMTVESHDSI